MNEHKHRQRVALLGIFWSTVLLFVSLVIFAINVKNDYVGGEAQARQERSEPTPVILLLR